MESYRQQDIQELCRELFDALEREIPEVYPKLVSGLYQGAFKSYVRCMQCGTENPKPERFLDVSLVIRDAPSLEVALQRFTTPEILEGKNGMCNKRLMSLCSCSMF
jgi:hypothetical protein